MILLFTETEKPAILQAAIGSNVDSLENTQIPKSIELGQSFSVLGIESWPSRPSHSLLLTSWALFSTLLVLMYSSLLINFLTFPAKSKVPTNWDELLKATDYDIMMEGESYIRRMFEVSW